jgi:uncharacterized protein YacL
MQMFLMVGISMALGAVFFVATLSMYGSELFLHGNPIGIRCVFACTGVIMGLPIGGLWYQAYSHWKNHISAAFILNAWVGLLVPIGISNLVFGLAVSVNHVFDVSAEGVAFMWGIIHLCVLAAVMMALALDPSHVLARGWPRLHETMRTVEEVLAPATRRILDLRFLLRHQILALASTGFLEGTWILPAATMEQLRSWTTSSSARIQHRSQRALANVNLLQHAYPTKLAIAWRHLPIGWGPTQAMWTESIRTETRILCARADMKAYTQGLDLAAMHDPTDLVVRLWMRALQSPYQPGDWLEVPILGRGRQHLQACSQVEDGTLVLIAQGAPYVGQRIRVQVVHVLHSVTGFVIFASAPES